jgi:hypothetical protein
MSGRQVFLLDLSDLQDRAEIMAASSMQGADNRNSNKIVAGLPTTDPGLLTVARTTTDPAKFDDPMTEPTILATLMTTTRHLSGIHTLRLVLCQTIILMIVVTMNTMGMNIRRNTFSTHITCFNLNQCFTNGLRCKEIL